MTALCGGGASRPRFQIPDAIAITTSGAAALLNKHKLGPFVNVVSSVMSGYTFASSTLCASDPPADPGLTPQDLLDALFYSQPTIQIPAAQRITQWFLHQYWYEICECAAVTTPLPPAPSNPGPGGNEPNVPVGAPKPCFTYDGALNHTAPSGSSSFSVFTAAVLPPVGPLVTLSGSGTGQNFAAYPTPAGLKSITSSITLDPNSPANGSTGLNLEFWDAGNVALAPIPIGNTGSHNTLNLVQVPTPVGATHWALVAIDSSGAAGSYTFSGQLAGDCGGPGFDQPCCPPDASLDLRLRQIIDLLLQIGAAQPGSAGYTLGTAHPSTSGTASLPVSGLRGMKVEITTGTPTNPQLEGNPPYEWNLGWMSILTGDGMIEEKRITRQHQVWLPSSMSLAVTFGYFLNPGVVATFTELVPA